jgi:ribosomal protein L11 methyltransferase
MQDFILAIFYDSGDATLEESVSARLFLTASTGNTLQEAGGTATLEAYFDTADERDAALADLGDLPGVELHAIERERIDWLEHYRQSLEPLFIGRLFVVAPDAALIPSGTTRHRLLVPQEQAFGTGSHETTALCIELLEETAMQGRRGLDVGAGSGILALAMCRLGAAKVIALDNDPDAYGALRDNRMRNGVSEAGLSLFIGGIESLRGGTFDVVTMNILPEVIVALLPDVVRHLREGSLLILSGILATRRGEVIAHASQHGLRVARELERGEWWAGAFEWSGMGRTEC